MWISVDECGRKGIKWDQCGSMWMKKGEVLGKMADWSRQKPAFFIMRSRGVAALRLGCWDMIEWWMMGEKLM